MNAVRLRRKLESETLHLPELRPLIGKTVQITVEEAGPGTRPEAEQGVGRGDAPAVDPGCFDSLAPSRPLDADTKKALASLLTPEQFQALADIADRGGPDVEAIRKLRAASMT